VVSGSGPGKALASDVAFGVVMAVHSREGHRRFYPTGCWVEAEEPAVYGAP
jgi:hypothetical protein